MQDFILNLCDCQLEVCYMKNFIGIIRFNNYFLYVKNVLSYRNQLENSWFSKG